MLASVFRTTPSPASSSLEPATQDTSTGKADTPAATNDPTQGWDLLTRNFILESVKRQMQATVPAQDIRFSEKVIEI